VKVEKTMVQKVIEIRQYKAIENLFAEKTFDLISGDADFLRTAQKNYGNSWKMRGGVGAYMMMARKFDRMYTRMKPYDGDIHRAIKAETYRDGMIDDLRDLRRYVTLVIAELDSKLQTPGSDELLDRLETSVFESRIHAINIQKLGGAEGMFTWDALVQLWRDNAEDVEKHNYDIFKAAFEKTENCWNTLHGMHMVMLGIEAML
jgi:hypothetical protein